MIHQVYLSDVTRRRLTDVVMLQLRLLRYAVERTVLEELGCAQYLDDCRRFRGRGSHIAAWLWQGHRKSQKRYEKLEAFAQGPTTAKREWYRRLAHEMLTFLRKPDSTLISHINKNATVWQNAGAVFLRNFYEDFCRSGLPGVLFSERGAKTFRRQDFLEEFRQTNRLLYICAACDETAWHTGGGNSISADIEHYFPKSHYPHLACHPFNLLPLCPHCNRLKGQRDPLQDGHGNRNNLTDILLPYREPGLASQTYLQVQLGTTSETAHFGELKPRPDVDLRQRIATFGRIYKVPDRWQGRSNTIGERLFSRIRDALKNGWNLSADETMPHTLLAALDYLLCDLSEYQGKEPFAFAMTWWLASLIQQEVEPAIHNPLSYVPRLSTFLQSLSITWQPQAGVANPTSSVRLDTARRLRGLLPGGNPG